MNDLPALSSFKHLRGKHYNKNHRTTPVTATFSNATAIITPPVMEIPRYPPSRHIQTYNFFLVDFNVLIDVFSFWVQKPFFFPEGISLKEGFVVL